MSIFSQRRKCNKTTNIQILSHKSMMSLYCHYIIYSHMALKQYKKSIFQILERRLRSHHQLFQRFDVSFLIKKNNNNNKKLQRLK